MTFLRLTPFLFAAACAMHAPQPAPADRIAAECALLAAAAARMATTGTPAHTGLSEGCPGITARDTRPLAQQTASLRTANAAALPPRVAPGGRAEDVFRRMITRGVPASIAADLATSDAFARAIR